MKSVLTRKLPPELLLRVIDELDISPQSLLFGPARVCSQWRALVRSHPTYSKHICLKKLRDGAFELFLDQLDAGYADNTDVHLTIDEPATIATLLPHIIRHFARCITFRLVYFASAVDLRSIFAGLSGVAAPKLQLLRLNLHRYYDDDETSNSDGDSDDEESTPPAQFPDDIFCGEAPFLQRLELSGTVCGLFATSGQTVTVPAFANVHSLELDYIAVQRAVLYPVLATLPRLRRLGILDSDVQPEPVNAALLASLRLDYLLFSSYTLLWTQTLDALKLDSLHELAIVPNESHASQIFFARQASSMRGPLSISVVESARPDIDEAEVDVLIRPHGHTQNARLLRVVGGFEFVRSVGWSSAPAFPPEAPVAHLEACVERLAQLYHVLPGRWFPSVETLVLRVHGGNDFANAMHRVELMLALPALQTVILQLCPTRSTVQGPQRLGVEVDAAQLAGFLKKRIGVTADGLSILTVCSPLVLVGDRGVLEGLVKRID